jgi:CrcB protein
MEVRGFNQSLIYVFVGGFLGGISRLLINQNLFTDNKLLSLTIVNILGTFILAMLSEFDFNQHLQSFLKTGFLGAFTSFGTLMLLLVQASPTQKILYLIISILGGIFATYIARKVAVIWR